MMRFEADGLANGLLYYDPLVIGVAPGDCVVVDFSRFTDDPVAFATNAEKWLNRLPCPSIALTSEPMRLPGFDISLSSEAEVARVEECVAASPVASTVLVQTLRLVEQLPVQSGLIVESLAFSTLQHGDEFRGWLADRPRPAPRRHSANDGPPVLISRDGNRMDMVLNRPDQRNEIGVDMRDALFETFTSVAIDPQVRHVHLRGLGDSFSIGGALSEFGVTVNGAAAHCIRAERLPARIMADHAERYHVHLHGACVGAGLELAAFAATVTAAPGTLFKLPEVSMGLIPGAGGCVSITKRIGRQGAAWMMLTGQRISAKTALSWGLIDAIEP